MVELFLEFLLRVDVVAVPLKQMRDTWLLRPLAWRKTSKIERTRTSTDKEILTVDRLTFYMDEGSHFS